MAGAGGGGGAYASDVTRRNYLPRKLAHAGLPAARLQAPPSLAREVWGFEADSEPRAPKGTGEQNISLA